MAATSDSPVINASSRLVTFLKAVDKLAEWSGKVFAWLVIVMAFVIGYEVVSRYVFSRPTMWAYDMTWMLYGTHFMMGVSYTLLKKGHIRTDLLYGRWSPRTQAWVDIIGYIVFFFPGMVLFFIASLDRALLSWSILEVSNATPWRPPIYPALTVMPVSIGLLLIQGACDVVKCFHHIERREGGYEI